MLRDFLKQITYTNDEVNMADEVVNSRPAPLRTYDQIWMKAGDMVLQTKLTAQRIEGRRVVFVGDGDSMSLMFGLFATKKLVPAPAHMLVLDFDKRVLRHIESFSERHGFRQSVETRLYNVLDPVPTDLEGRADWFYTNPPYGSKNMGESGVLFIARCMELCKSIESSGCIILPYDYSRTWTRDAMQRVQSFLISQGYVISDMVQQLHTYHLGDDPVLASSAVLVDRVAKKTPPYARKQLPQEKAQTLYGKPRRLPHHIEEDGSEEFYT